MNLRDFLLARLAEDTETLSRVALPALTTSFSPWQVWHGGTDTIMMRSDRFAAEITAKRRIIESECSLYPDHNPPTTVTLKLLAQPYASHPHFDRAWLLETCGVALGSTDGRTRCELAPHGPEAKHASSQPDGQRSVWTDNESEFLP
jgi:hypothetical protein